MAGLFDNLVNWITARGTAGTAIVTALVALTIFVLTRVVEIAFRWIDRRATRKRAVVGLFKEVHFNVSKLEAFLALSSSPSEIQAKVKEDRMFRPLLVIDETTQFYVAIIASLPDVSAPCLILLTEFYSVMHGLRGIQAAFESAAFQTISLEGRAATIGDLWDACRRAEKAGVKALYELELAYPRQWFSHFRS